MTYRTAGGARGLDRIEWRLFNPPQFTASDLQHILDCCPDPVPDSEITVIMADFSDGRVQRSSQNLPRTEALTHYLRTALVEFMLKRLLEAEPADAEMHKRLRQIQDAADKLQRALGLQSEKSGLQIPWPVGKRLLQASIRGAHPRGVHAARPKALDEISEQLANTLRYREYLRDALASIVDINHWAVAAASIERAQSSRQKSRRDSTLDQLVWALGNIWTDVLGQTLVFVTNSSRNVSRWAPIPESFQHFMAFCQHCVKPLGIELPQEELRIAVSRQGRSRKKDNPDASNMGRFNQAGRL
jgi:hypothetical protein